MTFEYPKIDQRKKEKISLRIDIATINKIKEISSEKNCDFSSAIRSLIQESIKKKNKIIF